MNFARNPAAAGDSLSAFIELAKDPKAFEAKLQAMRDAEASAKAAIDELAAKREEHNAREQALNARETQLVAGVKDLSAKAKVHSDRVEWFQKVSSERQGRADDLHTALLEREHNVKAAEDAAGKKQAEAENRLQHAGIAWSKATALHDKLAAIAKTLDGLKGALDALG